jgi:hypothetical protein
MSSESSESHEHTSLTRLLRRTDVALAVFAAAATVGFAWCGYQTSAWTRERFEQADLAADLSTEVIGLESEADRIQEADTQLFAEWVAALEAGETEAAAALVELFRPDFLRLIDERAIATGEVPAVDPFDEPEYSATELRREARELERQAATATDGASDASAAAARYSGIAVTFTAILAATGIAIRFQNTRLRRGFVIVTAALTTGALVLTVVSPVQFG